MNQIKNELAEERNRKIADTNSQILEIKASYDAKLKKEEAESDRLRMQLDEFCQQNEKLRALSDQFASQLRASSDVSGQKENQIASLHQAIEKLM